MSSDCLEEVASMKLKCECGAQIWPKDMEEIKMYSMLDCPIHGTHNFNIYQGNK